MSGKSLKLNVIVSLLRSFTTVIFPLVTFPYSSRVLGPEGNGKLNFATSFVGYFVIIAAVGIPMYGIRAIAQARSDKNRLSNTAQELFVLHLGASILIYLTFLVVMLFNSKLQEERILFYVTSSTIVFACMSLDWFYQGMEEYVYITIRGMALNVVGLVGLLLLVKQPDDYVVYAAITVLATVGSSVFNLFNARHQIFVRRTEPWNLLRHIKPMLFGYLLALIVASYSRLDTVLLGFLATATSVGYYTAALKITRMVLNIVNTFGGVLLPRLSYYISNNLHQEFDRMLKKSLGLVFFLCIPLVTGLVLLAPEAMLVFAGAQYGPATTAAIVTAPLILISGLSTVFGLQILYPLGKDWMVVVSAAVGAIICFLLSVLLIPRFHHLGSAIAITIAEFCVTATQFVMVSRVYKVRWPLGSMAKILVATAAMASVIVTGKFAVGIPWVRLASLAPLGGAAYLGVLYVLKEDFFLEVLLIVKKRLKLA
ncbi:MAG: flippase [Fibrobacterota bacterium]|nr:flippase [Fibrobacterota bacterium]QQS03805.1 MAG: flippase [Fibrobacterota bacterium]